MAKQWTGVQRIKFEDASIIEGKNYTRSSWTKNQKLLVEMIMVKNLGHAIPLNTNNDQYSCGQTGQWEKQAGICSTREILKFWDILP